MENEQPMEQHAYVVCLWDARTKISRTEVLHAPSAEKTQDRHRGKASTNARNREASKVGGRGKAASKLLRRGHNNALFFHYSSTCTFHYLFGPISVLVAVNIFVF
jgi:hypothetical protein